MLQLVTQFEQGLVQQWQCSVSCQTSAPGQWPCNTHNDYYTPTCPQELTWMQSMDDAEKQAQKRWVTHVWESALLALHRPAAVCLPVMAAVVSLRTGAEFLEALLAHHNQHAVISAWSGESFLPGQRHWWLIRSVMGWERLCCHQRLGRSPGESTASAAHDRWDFSGSLLAHGFTGPSSALEQARASGSGMRRSWSVRGSMEQRHCTAS